MNEILSTHTGKSPATIKSDTDRDLVLTPDDAVQYGVVDKIMEPREIKSYQIG